jgi:hypothetical protein
MRRDPLSKVGPEGRVVEWITLAFAFSPFPQFLGKPAVIGLHTVNERKTRIIRSLFHTVSHHLQVSFAEIREQIFKEGTFFRSLRVQGEGPPADIDRIFLFKPFNTPGNEIAPGSDIIGIYFKYRMRSHFLASFLFDEQCALSK